MNNFVYSGVTNLLHGGISRGSIKVKFFTSHHFRSVTKNILRLNLHPETLFSEFLIIFLSLSYKIFEQYFKICHGHFPLFLCISFTAVVILEGNIFSNRLRIKELLLVTEKVLEFI